LSHYWRSCACVCRAVCVVQANVSRIERSDNLYLGTLADYVDALGGHIEINAVFDDDVVSLGPVEKDRSELPA
jgi:hypothetical protein